MKRLSAFLLLTSLALHSNAQTKKTTTKKPTTTKKTTTTTKQPAATTKTTVDSVKTTASTVTTTKADSTIHTTTNSVTKVSTTVDPVVDSTITKSTTTTTTTTTTSSALSKGLGAVSGILGGGTEQGSVSSLTNSDIVSGLKEALEKGAQKSSDKLSVVDGFFANAALKILMPAEAKKVEKTLRDMGMGTQVDNAILAMNRAAEDAAKSASPIFINAIKSMSITDALGILKGSDTAATGYLRSKTVSPLTEAFRPVIETSIQKVDATKYWKTIFSTYNMISLNKINPDLTAYVTERALAGIFIQLGQEEAEIRRNPLARTSTLLQKVFGSK